VRAHHDHPGEPVSLPPTSARLGLLAAEPDRALVVLAADGELAVALRENLDRQRVVVKDARPEEVEDAMRSCHPWPWMLVGAVPELPLPVVAALTRQPVLVLWYGPGPVELPRHARRFDRFAELAAAAARALEQEVGGLRLAIGCGVDLPCGGYSRSAELQALVAAAPAGFDLPLSAFRSAAHALAAADLPWRPMRDPGTRQVGLRPAATSQRPPAVPRQKPPVAPSPDHRPLSRPVRPGPGPA